jgi:hypothetical protein
MINTSHILKVFNEKIKNIIWTLGLHAFLLILFLVFIDIILGALVFYQYVFLAEQKEPNITQTVLKFDEKTYQDVLSQLQTAEQNSTKSPTVEPINPSK